MKIVYTKFILILSTFCLVFKLHILIALKVGQFDEIKLSIVSIYLYEHIMIAPFSQKKFRNEKIQFRLLLEHQVCLPPLEVNCAAAQHFIWHISKKCRHCALDTKKCMILH